MMPSTTIRLLQFSCALLAAVGLGSWALHHAFGAMVVGPVLAIASIVFYARPGWGLWILPLLWPVIDLAPFTGGIHFPESLALVLCLVAGVGFREALSPPVGHPRGSAFRTTPAALLLFSLISVSYVVSSVRGDATLPPYDATLFAGYKTPLNAVRLLLGFAQCALLLPALHAMGRIVGPSAGNRLALGLVGGLTVAALAAGAERWQFTGLMNFSSDYRTTAQFWEMHVGGASLDAWLALCVPFALAGFLGCRSTRQRMAYLVVLALATYATLTTFSRGLYAAIAASVPLLLILDARRLTADKHAKVRGPQWGAWAGAIVLCALAPMSFAGGGYRGLAALLGFAWLAYLSGGLLARPPKPSAWIAMVAGLGAGFIAFAVSFVPKAVYGFYALVFLAAISCMVLGWRKEDARISLLAIGLTSACATAATAVGIHWGEGGGVTGIVLAPLGVGLIFMAQHGMRSTWHTDAHGATTSILVIGLAAALATGFGSYYVGERFSTTGKDFEGRMDHWRAGAELVKSREDNLLGIGLGRYPEAYYWTGPLAAAAGTWQLGETDGNRFARLGAPRHVLGFGELFRISQRLPSDTQPPFIYRFRARGHADTGVHLEVCRKHLLYDHGCWIGSTKVAGGDWQTLEIASNSDKKDTTGSHSSLVFSVAVSGRAALDVDDLEVIDRRGVSVLKNGDFQSGTDFWFFSSDRHHLPWHAKSLPLHVWIEQGWLGLLATGLTLLAAIGRLVGGRARHNMMAPPLVAGLSGFLVVGLFDSLLDMPRMTTIFYLALWLALVLKDDRRPRKATVTA